MSVCCVLNQMPGIPNKLENHCLIYDVSLMWCGSSTFGNYVDLLLILNYFRFTEPQSCHRTYRVEGVPQPSPNPSQEPGNQHPPHPYPHLEPTHLPSECQVNLTNLNKERKTSQCVMGLAKYTRLIPLFLDSRLKSHKQFAIILNPKKVRLSSLTVISRPHKSAGCRNVSTSYGIGVTK